MAVGRRKDGEGPRDHADYRIFANAGIIKPGIGRRAVFHDGAGVANGLIADNFIAFNDRLDVDVLAMGFHRPFRRRMGFADVDVHVVAVA